MNFSNVKQLTIPEGDVQSISINGTTVWTKPPTAGWHTIFEGNETCSWSTQSFTGSGYSNSSASAIDGETSPKDVKTKGIANVVTADNLKFRITYSSSASATQYYRKNGGSWSSTASSYTSPIEVDYNTSNNPVFGLRSGSTTSRHYITLRYVSNKLVVYAYNHDYPSSGTLSLTITKIEQYY